MLTAVQLPFISGALGRAQEYGAMNMSYAFGDFVLDDTSQSLLLRDQIQDVQPRVFDLLCYLVKNAGRVVPKDELLDTLWPGVIVTESSLQRAASLARRALARGGLGHAIQNFSKRGYRFAIDESTLGVLTPPASGANDKLAAAREAARALKWETAAALFAEIGVAALAADDLELWGLADECRGSPVDALPAVTRAVELHLAAGHAARAGRAAVTLAKIELERAASARAQGWIERARTILEGVENAEAHAYLLWMQSRFSAFAGRTEEALELGARSYALVANSSDNGIKALTLVYKGFYSLALGRMDEGTRLQNHAAAIALSSEVDPMVGSLIYCNILWACRSSADWERALQWSDGFEEWCGATFAENPGNCDLHRAEILGARGTLAEAFEKITEAIPKLSAEEAWSIGEGYRVRGDISYMLGDEAQAAADYETAYALGWDAEPGNAVLLAARGEVDAALAALDRSIAGVSWYHLQRKGLLLANAARIAAGAGMTDRAQHYLGCIAAEDERWSQPTVRALVAEARADLLAPADPAALQLRLLARQLWTSAKLDFHAARLRIELAQSHLAAGDPAGAEAELVAAERLAQRIVSPRLIARCAELRQQTAPRKLIAAGQR
jgi:DNA-binding winged helix-turn-helix (wHTH) protein